MDNDVISSPLSAFVTADGADDFLLVGGVIVIVLSSIFTLSSLADQSAFATFPGENGKIVFGSDRGDTCCRIYVMNADGSGVTRLADVTGFTPDWSPDGTKIAFEDGSGQISVMKADGSGGVTRLTDDEDARNKIPAWSPDGTKIVYSSEYDYDNDVDLYIMNADGSGQTRITFSSFKETSASWSPDGTKIAFTNTSRDVSDIYIMNADGSNPRKVGKDKANSPDWSPDGTKIAFSGGGIYVMNADGSGGVTRLTNVITHFGPSWSPDGTKITFHSNSESGNYDVYVINADGSGQTRITTDPATDGNPDWGPATVTEPPDEEDTTPPVLTVPENIVVEATSEQVAQVTFTVTAQDDVDGTATLEEDGTTITQDDNVGGDITIACSPASGSIFPLGDSLVQCSARDATGNFVRGSFTVTVNSPPPPPDTTRPVITVPEDITVEATSPEGAAVSFEVSAQDDEDGPTDVECDHSSGETFPIGETVVTCSAEDLAGNRADDKSFTITVQDTIAPDVEITEASDRRNGREITDGSTTNMRYIEITFQASDVVGIENTECSLDGAAFTSCTSPVVYDRLSRSTHQFTVRSTDAAGNTGEDQFTWTVRNPSAAAPGRQ